MSTRAKIVVLDDTGDRFDLYRHWDGYPSGALPSLLKAVERGNARNAQIGDGSYMAGAIIEEAAFAQHEHNLASDPDNPDVTERSTPVIAPEQSAPPDYGYHAYVYVVELKEVVLPPEEQTTMEAKTGRRWTINVFGYFDDESGDPDETAFVEEAGLAPMPLEALDQMYPELRAKFN